MKRTLAFLLALTMLLSLTATAFASDVGGETTPNTGEIVITNPYPNHIYTAYQIFTGIYVEEDGTGMLAGLDWGANIKNDSADKSTTIITALAKAYPTYFTNTATTTAADVAAGMEALNAADPALFKEALKTFKANLVGDGIAGAAYENNYCIPARNADGEQDSPLAPGYYMILDTDTTMQDTTTMISEYMVKVVGKQISITQKADEIKVTKQLLDTDFDRANDNSDTTNDAAPDGIVVDEYTDLEGNKKSAVTVEGNYQTGWQEVADYNIGDKIPFKVTVEVPDYSLFPYYLLVITEVVPKGLTLDTTSFRVILNEGDPDQQFPYVGSGKPNKAAFYCPTTTDANGNTVIKIAPDAYISGADTNGTRLQNNGGDLKKVAQYIKNLMVNAGNPLAETFSIRTITFYYTATLDSDAVIGPEGNISTTTARFSKDPYNPGTQATTPSADIATTPTETNVVYTYGLDVTKVDSLDETKLLPNAKFVLYRENADTPDEEGNPVKEYALVTSGKLTDWTEAPTTTGTTTQTIAGVGTFYTSSILTTDTNGKLNVAGLDDGIYYLQEVVAPSGFTLPDKPIKVEIDATHDADLGATDPLTGLQVIVDDVVVPEEEGTETGALTTGIVSIIVTNSFNVTLPETGGMGTTLFYILGGLLVVTAAVVLVTKKRMSA